MAMTRPRVVPLYLSGEDAMSAGELRQFMLEKEIPDTAELVYRGCGSHDVEFRWFEVLTPEEEVVRRREIAARQAAQEAEEADDRKAGF